VLDSRQSVSSRAIRNVRQEKPMLLPLASTVMLTPLGKIAQGAFPAGDSALNTTPCEWQGFVPSRSRSGSADSFLLVKHIAVVGTWSRRQLRGRSRLR
jgi:hypothetical protein